MTTYVKVYSVPSRIDQAIGEAINVRAALVDDPEDPVEVQLEFNGVLTTVYRGDSQMDVAQRWARDREEKLAETKGKFREALANARPAPRDLGRDEFRILNREARAARDEARLYRNMLPGAETDSEARYMDARATALEAIVAVLNREFRLGVLP